MLLPGARKIRMGEKFFGVDIQAEVAAAFSGQVLTGTLHKKAPGSRTPGSLTAGTNATETDYSFDGFLEQKEIRMPGAVSGQLRNICTIIAGTLGGGTVAPVAGDAVTIESIRFTITDMIDRDPAAAVYECVVE